MKKRLLFLLIIINAVNVIAQDDVHVDFILSVYKSQENKTGSSGVDVKIYSAQDTFYFKTNEEGVISCATNDGLKTIEMNETYYYELYINDVHLFLDSFNTNFDKSTRIFREVFPISAITTINIHPIGFIGNTLNLSPQGKIDFKRLSNFLEEEESAVLEFRGQYNKKVNGLLAVARANKIVDSLIFEGYFDRFSVNKPIKTDSVNAKVEFSILSFDYTPCTGGSVVNFDKIADTIVETRCDSLQFIANYVSLQEDNYAVIGIFTDKAYRHIALARAELVRKRLIALGIDEKRLRISTTYFKPPAEGDHHDWPFYPESYTYEIGVYINGGY